MAKIRRALLSVSEKQGLVELGRVVQDFEKRLKKLADEYKGRMVWTKKGFLHEKKSY